jgi:hypothetical protein
MQRANSFVRIGCDLQLRNRWQAESDAWPVSPAAFLFDTASGIAVPLPTKRPPPRLSSAHGGGAAPSAPKHIPETMSDPPELNLVENCGTIKWK